METRNTKTAAYRPTFDQYNELTGENELVLKRLNTLITANNETDRQKLLFRSEREQFEAELMQNPFSTEKAFAYLGLMLGAFPPLAFFTKFVTDAGSFNRDDFWLLGVFFIVNLISAVVGFFSGKFIGKTVKELEKLSWTKMLLISPFVGLVWGILAGGAGGAIIFLIGAIFGAMLGGVVGAAALPVFIIFHRLMKKGEAIEQKHFFPIAFGVTFTICAFILGL